MLLGPASSRLPYDILFQIVALAHRTTWTALCLVCRDFHHLAATRLYRANDFDDVAKSSHEFLKAVSSSHHLGSFVSQLSIDCYTLDEALAVFVPALRNMPNLQHFKCRNLWMLYLHDPSVLDVIAGLVQLRSFGATWAGEYNKLNELLDRLPPLQSIYIYAGQNSMEGLERLLVRSRDSLRSLAAHAWDLETFLRSHARGIVWPQMTELRLDRLQSTRALVEAFVNLETLRCLWQPISPEAMHILGDSSVLPRLRQLSILASARPETVDRAKRRRLPHLHIDVHQAFEPTSASLLDLLAAFSWQHLLSLQLDARNCLMLDHILEILPTLLEGCTQLAFLVLSYDHLFALPDTDPLSRMFEALNGLPASVRLPTLTYLVLCAEWEGENRAEVGSHMGVVEEKVHALFKRLSGLRELQCQYLRTESSWRRSQDPSLGGERLPEDVDKLPIDLPAVAHFLDTESHAIDNEGSPRK